MYIVTIHMHTLYTYIYTYLTLNGLIEIHLKDIIHLYVSIYILYSYTYTYLEIDDKFRIREKTESFVSPVVTRYLLLFVC
jgi:hypothetical protein